MCEKDGGRGGCVRRGGGGESAGVPQLWRYVRAGNRVLTIHMQDWYGNNQNARYSNFNVLPQDNRYQMFATGYSGTLPDDFGYSSGMTFQVVGRH